MSGLEIEALRLTEDECWASDPNSCMATADAQLAKAMWKYRDHLSRKYGYMEHATDDSVIFQMMEEIEVALEQANIERPE